MLANIVERIRQVGVKTVATRGLVAAGVAGLGLLALQAAPAGTFDVKGEAEQGSIVGNAIAEDSVGSSGGKAVHFGVNFAADGSYPLDTGMVNVQSYGAKGDGVTDDTQAILAAIHARPGKQKVTILYFPAGTYLISDILEWKLADGQFYSYLSFQGQGEGKTVIKLKDGAPGYQNPAAPKSVLFTADGNLPPYPVDGNGNESYFNYLEDLTVNIGSGNPGAIGINYIANNKACICNVSVTSDDGQGKTGISMLRNWPGPLLVSHVSINGFDTGIDVSKAEYGQTYDDITLTNQRVVGIRNSGNVMAIHKLTSTNDVPVIQNTVNYGQIDITDGTFTGGDSTGGLAAIDNDKGELLARHITTSKYKVAVKSKGVEVAGAAVDEFVSTAPFTLFPTAAKTLNLPIKDTPPLVHDAVSDWANVTAFGAIANDNKDDAAAIQQAIDSGKTTIYFPTGTYNVSQSIVIRGNVRTIQGFESIVLGANTAAAFNDAAAPTGVFKFVNGTSPVVTINRLSMRASSNSATTGLGLIALDNQSSRTLVLRGTKLVGHLSGYHNTSAGSGDLFVEDSLVGAYAGIAALDLHAPQQAWMRHLNIESNLSKVVNDGAKLWILGYKTEGSNTVLTTKNGGYTELLGGLFYPVGALPPTDVAIVNDNSHVSVSYATSAYVSADRDYPIHIREIRSGVTKDLTQAMVLRRGGGYAHMVPLYVGGN